jgi:hypothetical protein
VVPGRQVDGPRLCGDAELGPRIRVSGDGGTGGCTTPEGGRVALCDTAFRKGLGGGDDSLAWSIN